MKTEELIKELESCKGGEDLVLEEDVIDEIIEKLRELDELKRDTAYEMMGY